MNQGWNLGERRVCNFPGIERRGKGYKGFPHSVYGFFSPSPSCLSSCCGQRGHSLHLWFQSSEFGIPG